MKWPVKVLLCIACGIYLLAKGYLHFRHPPAGMMRFTPYVYILSAGESLYSHLKFTGTKWTTG